MNSIDRGSPQQTVVDKIALSFTLALGQRLFEIAEWEVFVALYSADEVVDDFVEAALELLKARLATFADTLPPPATE